MNIQDFASAFVAVLAQRGIRVIKCDSVFHEKFERCFDIFRERMEGKGEWEPRFFIRCNMHSWSDTLESILRYIVFGIAAGHYLCPDDGNLYVDVSPVFSSHVLKDFPEEIVAVLNELVDNLQKPIPVT